MKEMMVLSTRLYGGESLELASVMERFGRYVVTKQCYGQAEYYLKRALTINEQKRGKDHPIVAG